MLANQTEQMAFGKSGWHLTEITTDATTGDQTIYMGKCAAQSGSTSAPSWCIKKVTIVTVNGVQTITETYGHGTMEYKHKWTERGSIRYEFLV